MSVWDAFAAQVDHRGDAPALLWHGRDISYRDLHAQAVAARTRLARLGLGEGEPVAVLAKKSPGAVALVLGCLAARRPFLLPSPTLGAEPLRRLFEVAGCRRALTIDGDEPAAAAAAGRRDAGPTEATARLSGVSFMLTTSGSTGLPKVVPLRDDAIGRFVAWAGEQFGIGPGCTALNYAPLNFDLCLLDIWTTLARGGRVALVDPDLATQGAHLLDVLRHDVAVVQAVPMAYRLLLDAAGPGGRRFDDVRHVLVTGDTIPARTLAELPRLFPEARLYNVYGCTETNDSFVHEFTAAVDQGADGPLPIGRPVAGAEALIVGDDGTVVGGAGAGELWVSTPFQSDGYLGQPASAGGFGPHPAGGDDRRWFRTGDLVRRLPDGSLVLDGRTDFQVKVRGTAVNTAEVERVILAHPDVVETAVVAVPDPVAGRRLCCAVRRAPGSRLNSLVLRKHCAQRLAQAAIPSDVHIGDEPLPKTSTGKVDRQQVENTHTSRSTRS